MELLVDRVSNPLHRAAKDSLANVRESHSRDVKIVDE